ncbi:hypothetical protein PP301_gp067 [Gordonia phage GMA2]|uniref:Uncharacterized protein n=1 Tax=Gordonia phage GMA2 TaxID=1647283 RepID=A0A0K0N747_9CAUD|nr:hypothetical protein PP301_gp067 [Gordonia phage GMA2]AKJ72655.1 hypothetical protein GMA2_117 [Gordonia phage GMA2]
MGPLEEPNHPMSLSQRAKHSPLSDVHDVEDSNGFFEAARSHVTSSVLISVAENPKTGLMRELWLYRVAKTADFSGFGFEKDVPIYLYAGCEIDVEKDQAHIISSVSTAYVTRDYMDAIWKCLNLGLDRMIEKSNRD